MAANNWLWMAQWTVRNGLSANAGLKIAQDYGLGVRRATWLQAVNQIRVNYALRVSTSEALLVAVPQGQEIGALETKSATGYVQYVTLAVRDKTTGLISWRDQSIRTDTLMSREAAIDYVVGRYRSAINGATIAPSRWGTSPDEVVEGGMYMATHEFIPTV